MRYFLELSYNGSNFSGWQAQNGVLTVQQVVDQSLVTLAGPGACCTASGRTDAGVHARKQIVHFDAELPGIEEEFLYKLNAILPVDIAAHSLKGVKDDAHARYSATSRSYEYFIHTKKDPFRHGFSYYFKPTLDVEAMNEAAALMLGRRNFQCFSKVKTDVKNFDCELFVARWKFQNDSLVFFVTANRFLRGMVRAMVGTLLESGLGKLSKSKFVEVLESRDRRVAARNVPPEGLYLTDVSYPREIYIAGKPL